MRALSPAQRARRTHWVCSASGMGYPGPRGRECAVQEELPEGTAEILFIGNATLLIRYGELTLLTDPNFLHCGQHAHLGYGW